MPRAKPAGFADPMPGSSPRSTMGAQGAVRLLSGRDRLRRGWARRPHRRPSPRPETREGRRLPAGCSCGPDAEASRPAPRREVLCV